MPTMSNYAYDQCNNVEAHDFTATMRNSDFQGKQFGFQTGRTTQRAAISYLRAKSKTIIVGRVGTARPRVWPLAGMPRLCDIHGLLSSAFQSAVNGND